MCIVHVYIISILSFSIFRDAWSKLENMSKEEAMTHYVEEFIQVI